VQDKRVSASLCDAETRLLRKVQDLSCLNSLGDCYKKCGGAPHATTRAE
jgi:hypothetical protein